MEWNQMHKVVRRKELDLSSVRFASLGGYENYFILVGEVAGGWLPLVLETHVTDVWLKQVGEDIADLLGTFGLKEGWVGHITTTLSGGKSIEFEARKKQGFLRAGTWRRGPDREVSKGRFVLCSRNLEWTKSERRKKA